MDAVNLPEIDPNSSVPRYEQAKQILIRAIQQGTFPRGTKLPSTREVGDRVRVSLLTAHRAIQALVQEGWLERQRGRGTLVRKDFEQSVAAKSRPRVGLLIDPRVQLADYYHGMLMTGLRTAAAAVKPGIELSIEHHNTPAAIPNLVSDGVICWHPDREAFELLEAIATTLPIVVLGGSSRDTQLCCVDSANEQGARDAVAHLADLGHRDIAIINGRLSATNSLHRFRGYLAEMRERGLPIRDEYILNSDHAEMCDEVRHRLAALLRGEARPTAIVAAGYYLALDVLRIAEECGLRVPANLSLVGFDDPKSASLLNPPMTTLRQPLEQMGQVAVDLIMELIAGNEPKTRVNVLPTHLIVRSSTARLNGRA